MNYCIEAYQPSVKPQILAVWERAVLQTHHFLAPQDFEEFKGILQIFDFGSITIFTIKVQAELAGFIGLDGSKIDMLFIDPTHFRKGLGSLLVDFAIREYGVDTVDVNEQNADAVAFYKKKEFEEIQRNPVDGFGKNYPVLIMKRK